MDKLKSNVIESKDILQFLREGKESDFLLELDVANYLRGAGFDVQHGGLYSDPVTNLSREFDIRANNYEVLKSANKDVFVFSIECKNISKETPVLIICSNRTVQESYISYLEISKPHEDNLTEQYPNLKVNTSFEPSVSVGLGIVKGQQIYEQGHFVGKSITQLKKGKDGVEKLGSSNRNIENIYGKWSQCLSSLQDQIDVGVKIACRKFSFTGTPKSSYVYSESCSVHFYGPGAQNGKKTGASQTVITPTNTVSGTPIFTKSANEYSPGP